MIVSLDGTDYEIPSIGGSDDWGDALNRYLIALAAAIDNAPAAIPIPTVGTIPTGFAMVLEFSGKNSDNALRHLNWGAGSMAVACPAAETRIIMPWAGTVMSLIVQLDANYPNGGLPPNQTLFTVRKNGVGNDPAQNTTLLTDWGLADVGSRFKADMVHSFSVIAGDYIGITYNEATMNGAMTAGASAKVILVKS